MVDTEDVPAKYMLSVKQHFAALYVIYCLIFSSVFMYTLSLVFSSVKLVIMLIIGFFAIRNYNCIKLVIAKRLAVSSQGT